MGVAPDGLPGNRDKLEIVEPPSHRPAPGATSQDRGAPKPWVSAAIGRLDGLGPVTLGARREGGVRNASPGAPAAVA